MSNRIVMYKFVLTTALLLTGCGGGNDNNSGTTDTYSTDGGSTYDTSTDGGAAKTDGASGSNPNSTYYPDPTDGRALSFQTDSGHSFTAYGTKNGNGTVSAITALSCSSPDGSSCSMDLDSSGRISRITTGTGVTLSHEWISDNQVVLTAVTPNQQHSVQTVLTLDGSIVAYRRSNGRLAAADNAGNVSVDLDVCGRGATQYYPVWVSVTDTSNGESVGDFPCTFLGSGEFTTSIPTGQRTVPMSTEICNKLQEAMSVLCPLASVLGPEGASYVCASLSAAIDLGTIPSGEAIPLFAACKASYGALKIYCDTISASGVPGAPSLESLICQATVATVPSTLELQAYMSGASYHVIGQKVIVSSDSSFPIDLGTINYESLTSIGSITISPPAPIASSGYVASAVVRCLEAGSKVVMAVTDSDGHTIEEPYSIGDYRAAVEFDAIVAGEEGAVSDRISVTVTKPDGSIIKRSASVVFSQ